VLLDFFIVVVGVYIGIQAANWNDERQAREELATSLDRLQIEAELSVSFMRVNTEQFRRTVEARASVLRKTSDGNVAAVEQEELVLAINYLGLYPPVAPPRSVYDEIISAGQFRRLGNTGVREAITNYYTQLGVLSSFMSYARDMSDYPSILYHPAVTREFDPDDLTMQTHTVVDTDMALSDPTFVKTLQIGHGLQVLSMGIWENTLAVTEEMCAEIARYRGHSCAAIGSDSIPVEDPN